MRLVTGLNLRFVAGKSCLETGQNPVSNMGFVEHFGEIDIWKDGSSTTVESSFTVAQKLQSKVLEKTKQGEDGGQGSD